MTQSSWNQTRARSNYHFNAREQDTRSTVMTDLGHVPVTWQWDIEDIIADSQPATWRTRGYKAAGKQQPVEALAAEEYDLIRVGADPDMIITNLNWTLPASLADLSAEFALADCMARIHVQWPGQVWTRHIDKLQKWNPNDPSSVMRIMIQLTDWQPGQFWEWGNYHWSHWRAGDVTTSDWQNIPHCTANAGHHPRVTLQLTGVVTPATQAFLQQLQR